MFLIFHAFLSKLNLHDVLGVTYVVSLVHFFFWLKLERANFRFFKEHKILKASH